MLRLLYISVNKKKKLLAIKIAEKNKSKMKARKAEEKTKIEEVKKSFPSKKIEIFSSDTMNKKSSKEKLEKIINNEIEILVGTQLISKGFHFPNLKTPGKWKCSVKTFCSHQI